MAMTEVEFKPFIPIQSTAGAVPVKNEKGGASMQKVKVARYVAGKRPDYAVQDSSDEEEDSHFGVRNKKQPTLPQLKTEAEKVDRRLKRLQERLRQEKNDEEGDDEDRHVRRRRVHEPEVLGPESDEDDEPEQEVRVKDEPLEESSEEEELEEEEIERRRGLLRQRAKQQREEEEVLDKEEEKSDKESESESSEYEEYSDSEEEETGPRLKPVFVRKKDRVTIQEREKQLVKEIELEAEAKKMAEERRKQSLRIVEEEARKEVESDRGVIDACDAIRSDEENDEEEYEAWKIRELKRVKRDREEREQIEKEKLEIERLHNMTEEERKAEVKLNPKQITNKASKGKYKFLQKYYHRGSFFLDKEENVFTRDFSGATLEDHFDKTILPKVMQVKNFGRSGRTKYTHLLDQDTTAFDSPWATEGVPNIRKNSTLKQTFEKPSTKRK